MTTQQQFYKSLKTLLDKMQLLDQAEMQTKLADFKPAEVHTIQYIGQHIGANVTAIAAGMYVTRGAVSKMTKRLIRRELIEKYQSAENKKEVYFRLTAAGQKVYEQHEAMDRQHDKRDQVVFDSADPKQIAGTLQFLQAYNDHLDHELQRTKQGD
ncbi:MarR family transcriptional regulator [Secundilactobacillus silagei]|uniref:MarR family transcriptional regulator n=1 Tax=Secundilactobacillus silagei JCM 19001 TaxID=1302250 RepID=A0A1Z5IIC4_9LACO|nr:MarR family transcriptional regulator [Secundilactobacillus silagei]TDG73078.1 hypothetical protein C5L25_000719 [Secundilactobacillus silagei JCM 19001]GAX01517.1 MarR family transcriptional regulator [Secundilactobacillus silagei JCM 19001]